MKKAVPHHVSRGIILDQEHILVAIPLDGRDICFLPGGKIEDDEDSKTSVKRELQEELLIENLKVKSICEFQHLWKDRGVLLDEINYIFKIEGHGLTITKTPPNCIEDGIKFKWCKLTYIDNINLMPFKMIDILSNIGGR